jgi:hypothetical protein
MDGEDFGAFRLAAEAAPRGGRGLAAGLPPGGWGQRCSASNFRELMDVPPCGASISLGGMQDGGAASGTPHEYWSLMKQLETLETESKQFTAFQQTDRTLFANLRAALATIRPPDQIRPADTKKAQVAAEATAGPTTEAPPAHRRARSPPPPQRGCSPPPPLHGRLYSPRALQHLKEKGSWGSQSSASSSQGGGRGGGGVRVFGRLNQQAINSDASSVVSSSGSSIQASRRAMMGWTSAPEAAPPDEAPRSEDGACFRRSFNDAHGNPLRSAMRRRQSGSTGGSSEGLALSQHDGTLSVTFGEVVTFDDSSVASQERP